MSEMRITKRFRFESAHQLPWHEGKCHNLHGHSYILEITVRGNVVPIQHKGITKHPSWRTDSQKPDTGMVLDFSVISDVVKPFIAKHLDHKSLNDILENPTAENVLLWLTTILNEDMGGGQMNGPTLLDMLNTEFAKYYHGVFEAAPYVCRMRLYETADSWAEIDLCTTGVA